LNKRLRSKLAVLWRECIRKTSGEVFDKNQGKRIQFRHKFDEIPQPGFVGFNYRRGGILFVGINPGSAKPSLGLDYDNLILYGQLAGLGMVMEEDIENIEKRFDALNGFLLGFRVEHGFFKQLLGAFLTPLDITLNDVAYINLLKWRTEETRNLDEYFDISWEKHCTREQIRILAPGHIIALGETTGKWLKKKRSERTLSRVKIHTHSRRRNITKEQNDKNIKRICKAIRRKDKR